MGRASFSIIEHDGLLAGARRIVAASGFDGQANFDAVIESRSGLAYFVDCNPRFSYTVYLAMILGRNFVEIALNGGDGAFASGPEPGSVRRSILRNLGRAWTNGTAEWRLLGYELCDPLPLVAARCGWFDDDHLAADLPVSGRPDADLPAQDLLLAERV